MERKKQMAEKSILDVLENYKNANTVRFHMPSHKGKNTGSFLDPILTYDVTELDMTDDFFRPKEDGGVLASFRRASSMFGTANTVYSAGGATLCLQTALCAALRKSSSRTVVCDRRAHMSVINALALLGAEPRWFFPGEAPDLTDAAAMLITSPNYYGECADISVYAKQCQERGIPLITDNSHGSHLAFTDGGNLHPYKLGSSLVIDSVHKTLPSMTGAALLHSSDEFTLDELLSAMSLFSSTSPSYIILSSIDAGLDYIEKHGKERFAYLKEKICSLKSTLTDNGYEIPSFKISDPLRLTLKCANAEELYAYLTENGVIPEFCDSENVVFIPSIMNNDGDFEKLERLCLNFKPQPTAAAENNTRVTIPKKKISIREAVISPRKRILTEDCEGCIAAGPIVPYPPGIPLVMPGEYIDAFLQNEILSRRITYVEIVCQNNNIPIKFPAKSNSRRKKKL